MTKRDTEVFGNSDWASFGNYVVILAEGTISLSSKNQETTALSAVEAEYLSMKHTSNDVL